MKYTSKGKEYNTNTAQLCTQFKSFFEDKTISLYRKSTGEFFIYTEYERPEDGISSIQPLTYEEAKRWAYEELDLDVFYKLFVEPFEETSKKTSITMSLHDDIVESLKKLSTLSGVSMSEYAEGLIRAAKEKADAPQKVEKYDVHWENAPRGSYMCVTITDLLGEEIKLDASVYDENFPYFHKLMHEGLKEKGVFDGLTEDEIENIDQIVEELYSDSLHLSCDCDDYLLDTIKDIREVLSDNCMDFWAYDELRKDIVSQAKKYGIFPEEIKFEPDQYIISQKWLEVSKEKFYFDTLKEMYKQQQ